MFKILHIYKTILDQTSLTGLDEEKLRLSLQTRTVLVREKVDDVEYSDRNAVARVDDAEVAVGKDYADECVVAAVVHDVIRQHQLLPGVLHDVDVNLYVEVKGFEQFLQHFFNTFKKKNYEHIQLHIRICRLV